jgi:crossover junction endodeoxyribonuclease RuvC
MYAPSNMRVYSTGHESLILAIDPGYDRVGVAVVKPGRPSELVLSECIQTNKKDPHEKASVPNLSKNHRVALTSTYHPTHIALETLFFSVNKKTAIKVAESRGVIVLIAGQHDLPLIELSPQEVKLAMAGVGNADKKQVQKMVALTLKIDISQKIDDEIDAIALGFAASETLRVNTFH